MSCSTRLRPKWRLLKRGKATGPFQDQRGRHMRGGTFRCKIREGAQGCLLRGKLHSKSAIELDEAVDMVMHHDAHPGHG